MFDPFFLWLEATTFSIWMRESPSLFAFPLILAAHTIGLGLLAGVDVAHDLRRLGLAPRVPVAEFDRFLPVMWFGLVVNVLSGVALLIGYPTKALTNPVFYLKLTLIAVALVIARAIRRPRPDTAKALAILSLLCWAAAITAGRLLAYTYTRLDALSVPR
ncbi:MAG: hypothetical protein HY824_00200 [Acidobacteria bacterium]|nr:hypothetical protein [Acidobacteriota bacterium]